LLNLSPWTICGDFNGVLYPSEKWEGVDIDFGAAQDFIEVVNKRGLQDLGFKGFPFTWTNRQKDVDQIEERLDRLLAMKS